MIQPAKEIQRESDINQDTDNTSSDKTLMEQFQKFFQVSGFFSRGKKSEKNHSNDSVSKKMLNIRKKALDEQAAGFLEAHSLNSFSKMLSNGYEASEVHMNSFNQQVFRLIKDYQWDTLASLIKTGFDILPEHYARFMNNEMIQAKCLPLSGSLSAQTTASRQTYDYNGYQSDSLQIIREALQTHCEEASYSQALFADFMDKIKTVQLFFYSNESDYSWHDPKIFFLREQDIDSYCACAKLLPDARNLHNLNDYLFNGVEMKDYTNTIGWLEKVADFQIYTHKYNDKVSEKIEVANKNWKNTTHHLQQWMVQHFDQHYPSDIDKAVLETQSLYMNMDEVLSKKANESHQKNLDRYSVHNLPEVLNNQVQSIQHYYNTLLVDYEKLNIEDQHNLQSLVGEKLPQYINEFLSMKEEYRTSLVNSQGKNAQDLLGESLNNIQTHLEQIELHLNEEKLKGLSVGAKYTQAKNKF